MMDKDGNIKSLPLLTELSICTPQYTFTHLKGLLFTTQVMQIALITSCVAFEDMCSKGLVQPGITLLATHWANTLPSLLLLISCQIPFSLTLCFITVWLCSTLSSWRMLRIAAMIVQLKNKRLRAILSLSMVLLWSLLLALMFPFTHAKSCYLWSGTAHIRSFMALITPVQFQQMFMGHMIISAFVSLAIYGTFKNIFIVCPKAHTSFLASSTSATSLRVHCHPFYFEPPSLILGIHTNAHANSLCSSPSWACFPRSIQVWLTW